jgi:hypothetical protein
VLVSLRNFHTVAAIDLEREVVDWALHGPWQLQHEPVLTPEGTLLLFDNQGLGRHSRVLELDPSTQRILWSYRGDEENGFFSATLGSCQRLPNGNTLITESEAGRAFEVTRENEIVWEFRNPARSGEKGDLVATLFEISRLPDAAVPSWASPPTGR